MEGTPNSRINFKRLGSSGNVEESIVSYDNAGKQIIRVDLSDHANSVVHSDPHLHETVWTDAGKQVFSKTLYNVDETTGMMTI